MPSTPTSPSEDDATEDQPVAEVPAAADATASDATATDEAEEAPPMNRAERRLAERQKKKGTPSGRAGQPQKPGGNSSMRGRGFQSAGRQRGTNTRRSG